MSSFIEVVNYTIDLNVQYVNTTTKRALKLKPADVATVLNAVSENFVDTIKYSEMEQIKINHKAENMCVVVLTYAKSALPTDEEVLAECVKTCGTVTTAVGDKNVQFKITNSTIVNREDGELENEDDVDDDDDEEEEVQPIVPTPAPTPTKTEKKAPNAPKKAAKADTDAELATPTNLIEAIENVISAPAKKGGRPKKTDEEKLAEKERKLAEKKEQKEADMKRKLEEKLNARELEREEQKEAKKEERNAKRRELNAILKGMTAEEQAEYKATLKAQAEQAKAEKKAQTDAKKAELAAIREAKAKIPVVPKKTKVDTLTEQLNEIVEELTGFDYTDLCEMDVLDETDIPTFDAFCSLVGIKNKTWSNVSLWMSTEDFLDLANYKFGDAVEQNMKDMQSRVRFYKKTDKMAFENATHLKSFGRWMFAMFELLNHEKKTIAQKARNAEKQAMISQIKAEKEEAAEAEKQRKIDEKAAKKAETERKKAEREAKKAEAEAKKAAKSAEILAAAAAIPTD